MKLRMATPPRPLSIPPVANDVGPVFFRYPTRAHRSGVSREDAATGAFVQPDEFLRGVVGGAVVCRTGSRIAMFLDCLGYRPLPSTGIAAGPRRHAESRCVECDLDGRLVDVKWWVVTEVQPPCPLPHPALGQAVQSHGVEVALLPVQWRGALQRG